MCEISEIIYNEGRLETTKETAFSMKEKGYSDDVIADILKTELNALQQWWAERDFT